jgi:hypothetical protein
MNALILGLSLGIKVIIAVVNCSKLNFKALLGFSLNEIEKQCKYLLELLELLN